ncbi:hypothetical protein GO986_20175 [Deinococcus sp. HMF7620]|uniref:MHYT domain-containing protein n=1 Tax=Deinococcus arboris TaxID=2682977 RepID=A0A7C9LTH9_9DEIO|nr:hypothetical protein [Deinococcus arboris]MVN89061.1 hypothetical protein [Deinococcus arboris]
MEDSGILPHTWNSSYLVMGYLILALGSYLALEFAGRAGSNIRNVANRFWLVGQVLVFGHVLWATHFLAKMAFGLNTALTVDYRFMILTGALTLLALFPAFLVVYTGRFSFWRLGLAGTVAGGGLALMHYVGRFGDSAAGTEIQVNGWLMAAFVLVSILVSSGALYLSRLVAFRGMQQFNRVRQVAVQTGGALLISAGFFGAALLGMASLSYRITDVLKVGNAAAGADVQLLTLVTIVISFLLLGLAVTSVLMDAGRSGDDELDFGDLGASAAD